MTEQNHQALLLHIQWASEQLASRVNDKKFQKELTRCRSKNVAKVCNRNKGMGSTKTFAKLNRHGIKSFLAIRSIVYGSLDKGIDTEQYINLTILFGSGLNDPVIEICFRPDSYPQTTAQFIDIKYFRFQKYRKRHPVRDSLEILYGPEYDPIDYFIQMEVYLIQKGFLTEEIVLNDFISYLQKKFRYKNKNRSEKIIEGCKKTLTHIIHSYRLPFHPKTFPVYIRKTVSGMFKRKRKPYYESKVSPIKKRKRTLIFGYAREHKVSKDSARKWLNRNLKKKSLETLEVEHLYPKGYFKKLSKKVKSFVIWNRSTGSVNKVGVTFIKHFRCEKGWTMDELSKETGLPIWKIKRIEAGEMLPTQHEFIRIHKVIRNQIPDYDKVQKCPVSYL